MLCLANSADTMAIFTPFIYLYNAVYYMYRQDVKLFIDIAAPILGECVLDLGINST
jgi:hypothetical protein